MCFIVINGISALSTIITNIPIFISVLWTLRLHTPSFILIFSIAISDLGVGLIVQPLYIAYLFNQDNVVLWQTYQAFAMYFLGASIINMVYIAVDRWLAILLHMRYQQIITTQRTINVLVFLWGLDSVLLGFFAFVDWTAFQYLVAVLTSLSVTIVAGCYHDIFRIVRRHRRQIESQRRAINAPRIQHGRSLRNMFYLHGFYALSLIPMAVYLVYGLIVNKFYSNIWRATVTCALINSTVNPFVNVFRMKELKDAILKLYRKLVEKIRKSERSVVFDKIGKRTGVVRPVIRIDSVKSPISDTENKDREMNQGGDLPMVRLEDVLHPLETLDFKHLDNS